MVQSTSVGLAAQKLMLGLTGSASTTTFPGLVTASPSRTVASRNALVTRTKPGHVCNSSGSGYAPHLARNAAFSGWLYQAAIWLYISSNFGAEGSGSVRWEASSCSPNRNEDSFLV